MNHGSLFSGIGGFDLAAEWMGWNNLFHCEWNPFGQKVLKHYWPEAESFNDITQTDFTKYANRIQILTGGFPCQPYSLAGKRKGKDDERHLWPEMLRAIREIRPRWVVGENVLGLVNWSGGLVFHEVQADLEAQGYEVQPFLLPAAAVNAPHRRDRIWFVAYSNSFSNRRKSKQSSNSCEQRWSSETYKGIRNKGKQQSLCDITSERNATDTDSSRTQTRKNGEVLGEQNRKGKTRGFINDALQANATNTESVCIQGQRNGQRKGEFRGGDWCRFPTQSPICSGDDGLPTELDGITFSKWRNESIKGYGNAIVPQVVYQIFKAIQEYERNNKNL